MSSKNVKAFKMMVKALVIQSFMPVFFSFPTKLLYLVVQFGAFHSITAEYLMFAMSPAVSIVDPCITLYYVLPYRRYLKKKLGLVKKVSSDSTLKVDPVGSTVTKSANHLSSPPTITDISHDI
ncbi:hypothetical protein OESDEN_19741 [Oesophagostomum dentatum]|uniref:Uncharacterized protein n=1 Tax=Oesophagostomum dentatum TaxID=61180 RepID=A0A0B1SAN8_OESDE|nr:hypothetical protein OESDEN_19741 [Oesophagostomum dentatum]